MASTLKKRSLRSPQTSSAAAAKPSVGRPTLVSNSASTLSDALASSLESVQAAALGDSLCTVRGERVQATKYFEGRVVALRQLVKATAAHVDDTAWSLGDHAPALATQWRQDVGAKAEVDPGWESYLAGACDAFEEFSSR